MLQQLTDWIWAAITSVFTALWGLVGDAAIAVVDGIVTAFTTLIAAIPVPGWMSGGLASSWTGMDSGVLYIVTACGVPAALGLIGAGYVFRFARKIVTLFQW